MKSHSVSNQVGLGTGTLASLGRAASLRTVCELLQAVADSGSKVIDTADSYGSGDCEILLGRAIRQTGDTFDVITKAGYRFSDFGGPLRVLNQFAKKILHKTGPSQRFDGVYLEKCLEGSLLRLRRDSVFAFLLHDPPSSVVENPDILERMQRLTSTGKIQHPGVSSGDPNVLARALDSGVFRVIQTPANLRASKLLFGVWKRCRAQEVTIIGNHVFAPDLLSKSGVSRERLMRAAVGMLPDRSTVLCGTRNSAHFLECAAWARHPMTNSEIDELRRICGLE